MTEEGLKQVINEVFDKHINKVWITPYYCKLMIPSEEIPKLKEELFISIKELNKRRTK